MILALHSEKLLYLTATLHFLLGLQMSMFPKHKGKHRLNRGRFLGVDKRSTRPNSGKVAHSGFGDGPACSGLLRFPVVHEPCVNDNDADEQQDGALRCHPKIQRPTPNHHSQITRKKTGAKAHQQPDQQEDRSQNAFLVNESHDIKTANCSRNLHQSTAPLFPQS